LNGKTPAPPAPPFTLVIPAYNEAERIANLLAQIEGADGEFIFVCDGDDDTPRIVMQFAHAHPGMNIRCLHRAGRMGKGSAIRDGISMASAPLVGYVDADASTSFPQMRKLFSLIDGADAVIGSRWVRVPSSEGPRGCSAGSKAAYSMSSSGFSSVSLSKIHNAVQKYLKNQQLTQSSKRWYLQDLNSM